jgi:hypothetical protein
LFVASNILPASDILLSAAVTLSIALFVASNVLPASGISLPTTVSLSIAIPSGLYVLPPESLSFPGNRMFRWVDQGDGAGHDGSDHSQQKNADQYLFQHV